MLGKIELSLKNAHGHAMLTRENNVVIYLRTLKRLLSQPELSKIGVVPGYFPFHGIEELIEEFVIHELLHAILPDVMDDYFLDSWHVLECRLRNNLQGCNCPIDCFFRDSIEEERIWHGMNELLRKAAKGGK